MKRLQALGRLLPYVLPLNLSKTRHSLLRTARILAPVQRERDVEQLAREGRQLVQAKRITSHSGSHPGREEFVVAHRQQRLCVQIC